MKAHKASFTKTLFIKVAAATTVLTVLLATSAFANAYVSDELAGFKIAVINGSAGSAEIVSGDYPKGLKTIGDSYSPKANTSYAWEYEFGLCAANLKMKKLAKAEHACSRAITTMPRQIKHTRQGKYLHAIALSNRGIVRYIANDIRGALADFNRAQAIDNNSIVTQNLTQLTTSLAISNKLAREQALAAASHAE